MPVFCFAFPMNKGLYVIYAVICPQNAPNVFGGRTPPWSARDAYGTPQSPHLWEGETGRRKKGTERRWKFESLWPKYFRPVYASNSLIVSLVSGHCICQLALRGNTIWLHDRATTWLHSINGTIKFSLLGDEWWLWFNIRTCRIHSMIFDG